MKKQTWTVLLVVMALLAVYFVIKSQFFTETDQVKGVVTESVATGDTSSERSS